MKYNRRDFLKISAAAAAAASAPQIMVGRARAATPFFGQVKHVLVLFCRGGLRSHCLFNAVGKEQHNPFGVLSDYQTVAAGTDWTPGALYHDASGKAGFSDMDLSGGALGEIVPGFHQITNDITVLPCVDHNPTGSPDVNHDTATQRVATGDPYGLTGLLSRVGAHHDLYSNGFSATAPPPVEIQGTEFGLGAGDYARTRPLTVQGADNVFSADLPIGKGWKIPARELLNERFRDHRSRAFRKRISELMLHKTNTATFASMLQDPVLNVVGDPTGTDAGITNEQILEVLGDYMLNQPNPLDPTEPTDMQAIRSWGSDVAMALRFFSFGVPMAVVTRSIYDMHDNERDLFRPRTLDLARQFAGLNYLLKRMPHPDGGTYWDHTLVTAIGEFSRNNTLDSGFNSGNGSDHVTNAAGPSRNQAVPMMGGVLEQAGTAGKIIGSTDSDINATGEVFGSRQWLSTLLDVVGVDPAAFWPDAAINELFTTV